MMRFSSKPLNDVVQSLLTDPSPERNAYGENFHWEERVSDARRAVYERAMDGADLDEVEGLHDDYVLNHVNIATPDGEPVCFAATNGLALTPEPHLGERLVRVENLTGWAKDLYSGSLTDLRDAFTDKPDDFKTFFDRFNTKRRRWPMFAAFADDLDRFGDWRAQWATLLPDLLGLGHLKATKAEPKLIARIEYTVKRVMEEGGPVAREHRFAAPTVIDHKLNHFFLPSPVPTAGAAISYGRAVNLAGRGTLVCEVIHRHISYELEEVKAVELVEEWEPTATLRAMRNAHVEALRKEPGCEAFAKELKTA